MERSHWSLAGHGERHRRRTDRQIERCARQHHLMILTLQRPSASRISADRRQAAGCGQDPKRPFQKEPRGAANLFGKLLTLAI